MKRGFSSLQNLASKHNSSSGHDLHPPLLTYFLKKPLGLMLTQDIREFLSWTNALWVLSLLKKRVLFALCNILTLTMLPPTSTLCSRSFETVCLTTSANPSTTIRKRKGVRGSPYLSSLPGIIFVVGLPLIMIYLSYESNLWVFMSCFHYQFQYVIICLKNFLL